MRRDQGLGWKRRAGVALICVMAALPASGQYGGMGGLGGISTGSAPDISASSPSRLAFRPWLSANGVYGQTLDAGLSPDAKNLTSYGYGAAGGLSGGKTWEKTAVGAFYSANYQHYVGQNIQRGASQVGGLTASHVVSEKVSVYATQMAGSSLGGFGFGAPAGAFGGFGITGAGVLPQLGLFGAPVEDLAANGIVDNEAFGSRVNFYGTSAGINFQPTLRWSVGGSANAGYVRRKGRGLQDLNSYGGGGNVAYRVNERTTIGGGYRYGTFSYPNFFGGNRVHQAGLVLSHQLGPLTTVRVMAGGYRFNSTFLGRVQVDPEVAALLGTVQQLEVQSRRSLGWMGGASLSRNWREWGLGVSYNHNVSPGNGLILASRRDSVTGSGSRSIGKVSAGVFGGYYRSSGLIQNAVFESGSVGASMGVRLIRDVHMGVNGGYSYYQSGAVDKRWRRFISVNLTWSPSDSAFRF